MFQPLFADSVGTVDILARTSSLVDVQVEAFGAEGGGEVRIGGDYKGEGSISKCLENLRGWRVIC